MGTSASPFSEPPPAWGLHPSWARAPWAGVSRSPGWAQGVQGRGSPSRALHRAVASSQWLSKRMGGWLEGWMDRYVDGQMDRGLEGQMGGGREGGMRRWMRDGRWASRWLAGRLEPQGKGASWPGERLQGWGPHRYRTEDRASSLCLTRRASVATPCWAQPLLSATGWWMPRCTWPPAPRTCAAAPPAHVPPSPSTLVSVPTPGDSRRAGGALTSAVSAPMHWGGAQGPAPTLGPWGECEGGDPQAGHLAPGWGSGQVEPLGGPTVRGWAGDQRGI